MLRPLRRREVDALEDHFAKDKKDKTAERIGNQYTRAEIARLEEAHVPWLRRRRRRS